MPEVQYSTTLECPIDEVWDFVQDMNNWAPFMTGYQEHEQLNEKESVWTLKGDVGVLARTVKLKANITDWSGPERVEFTLEGLNESVDGGGLLVMAPTDGTESDAATEAPRNAKADASKQAQDGNWFTRFFATFFRMLFGWLFRMKHGKVERAERSASAGPGSRLTFTLRMDAGGPTGPLVNAMLGPALYPAAEHLANKIAAHLESSGEN
jgi:carbon monoxide dehydrogenase subunit G